jgi:hypothetical protein
MRAGSAPRAPCQCLAGQDLARRLNTQRVPVALAAGGAARPPEPPAFDACSIFISSAHASGMLNAGSSTATFMCLNVCLHHVETLNICCWLISARRHACQALGRQMHRIGVPRGKALGRECRGRGRSLPPAAQANCSQDRNTSNRGTQGQGPGPGVQRARPPSAAACAGH